MKRFSTFSRRVRSRGDHYLLWSRILAQDLARYINWNIRGGRSLYESSWREIASHHKWCFIIGCNNSGTSLLQRMLDQTGQVSTFQYEGQRYTRALERSERKKYERVWSEYIDDLILRPEDGFEIAPRLVHDWIYSLGNNLQPIIVEKTPANTVRMRWLQEVFPNSYFIGLVRNGYAVVEGTRRKSNKSIERSAIHWNKVNHVMFDEARGINNFLLLKYEDIARNPKTVSESLSNFLGVSSAGLENALGGEYSLPTVTGEKSQGVKDLNGNSIARLSDEELNTIYIIAGEMLDHFGYGDPKNVRSMYG